MHLRPVLPAALLVMLAGCSSATSPERVAPGASTSPAPTEQPAPSAGGLTGDDALGVVDDYFAAYDAGDIAGMMDLLTSDFREQDVTGEFDVEQFRHWREWEYAQGTEMLPRDCEAVRGDPPDQVIVTCEYAQHQYLSRVVGGPAVPYTNTFVITPEGIAEIGDEFGNPDFNVVNQPFDAWMRAHHPEDADAAACCSGDSVEDARERGALRAEYADRWAAWLDGQPTCTWRDIACQSDGA